MLFDQVTPPANDLLYKRNDPNDVRWGEVVHFEQSDYEQAQVVLIGCPQDEGVRRNKGRVGAAQAPDTIRRAFYRLAASPEEDVILFDIGNTRIQPTLEATHDVHMTIIKQLIEDGKQVISLGGGNDLAYADCSGLAQVVPNLITINVDAHFDVRADTVRNSGTPYRQLLDEGLINPKKFYEVGSLPMANSKVYEAYLQRQGVRVIPLETMQHDGIAFTFDAILNHEADAIFWGLDMDVVHVADAPGVSAPNTFGISAHQFCQLATIAGRDNRSRVFEITEVNPIYDIDDRTSRLAAAAIWYFLANILITSET